MRFILILLVSLLSIHLSAQQTRIISGYITDAQTGERLYAATVYEQNSGTGAISNRFGFFSLSVPDGITVLKFSFVGYETQTKKIESGKDEILQIRLKSDNQIEEVVVKGNSTRSLQEDRLGQVKLSAKTMYSKEFQQSLQKENVI